MNIREQRISERIAKLKELGIYEQWEKNVEEAYKHGEYSLKEIRNYLLGALKKTSDTIQCSFMFERTPEGVSFWETIVDDLIRLGD